MAAGVTPGGGGVKTKVPGGGTLARTVAPKAIPIACRITARTVTGATLIFTLNSRWPVMTAAITSTSSDQNEPGKAFMTVATTNRKAAFISRR